MGLFGDLVTNALGGFPSKPEVPGAPNVNAQVAQGQATAGNQAALPGLEELASATNQFNVGQRQSMLNQAIPGYGGLTGQGSNVLSSWLSGNLSPDVASAVRRNAGSRAFAGGYGGSGMGENLTARDLGLTSTDLQKQGLQQLNPFVATTGQLGMPQQFLPQSQYVTTPEQIGINQWNETNRFGHDWLQNQLNALPDPATAAIARDVGGMVDPSMEVTSLLGDVYGGKGSGGGGGASASFAGGGWNSPGFNQSDQQMIEYYGLNAGGQAAGGGAAASGGGY